MHDQRGSAAVIAVIALTVMLGFSALVLDLGVSYHEAAKLQNALDSAALAGARELPAYSLYSADWTAVKNEAMAYAAANHYPISDANITPIYEDDISTNEIIGLTVTDTIEVEYNFAKVLGINSGTITRSAGAGLAPAGGIRNAVPLSITDTSLQAAIDAGAIEDLTIKCSPNTDEIGIDEASISGWFAPLRFDGTARSVYEYLISYGYDGPIYVGQVLDIENGNMSGPTLDGFTTRFDACTDGCTAESFEPDCPRLIYIPVISILDHGQVRVEAFAAFFLTECGGSGKDSYIKATYIPDNILPNTPPGQAERISEFTSQGFSVSKNHYRRFNTVKKVRIIALVAAVATGLFCIFF